MTELGNKDEEITELSDQLHSVTRDLDSKTSEVTKLSKQLEELLVF
jgi:ABC-type transporter Mla subunit MlaD